MFLKKKKKETTIKIDKLVTWFIIGWAVAWLIGLSKTKKWKEITRKVTRNSKSIFWKTKANLWKIMIKIIKFTKNDKND